MRSRFAVLLTSVVLAASLLPALPAAADDAPPPSAPPVDGSSAPAIPADPEPLQTFPAIPNPTISKSNGIPPKLTASDLIGVPSGSTVKWAWLRDGHAISGATSASYTVTVSDAAHTLTARATITKSGYTPKIVTSDDFIDFYLVLDPSFTITGGNHVGEVFVVSPLQFTKPGGGPIDLSTTTYQWRRNGVAIPGATDDQYQVTGADAGKAIAVLIVATTPGYLAFSFAPITDSPGKAQFVLHAVPGISGPVGKVLNVSVPMGAIEDPYPLLGSPYTLTYQWMRNSVNIPGATHETYLLTSADVGTETSVTVYVRKLGYDDASTGASGFFTMMPNAALAVTQTNGPPHIGTTLSVVNPGFSANGSPLDPDLTYRWMRDGATISGASTTSGNYVITAADQGHVVSVRVTAHEFSGNYPDYVWIRNATEKIGIFAFAPNGTPTVSATGSPATLAVTNLGVVAVGGMKVAYQWMRNSAPISGATKSTYKLTPADVGSYTYVRLTFTAPSYTPYVAGSASTSYTLAASGAPGISPSGTPKVGDTLTAVVPNYTTPSGSMPTPPKVFQWLRNGVAISGETNPSYIVRSGDKGAKISLRITASWPGLNQATGTSLPTAAVASGVLIVNPLPPVVTVGATSLAAAPQAGSVTTPQVTLKYQWYRGGVAVSGATKATYVLGSADKNKAINVRIIVTKANVLPASATLPLSTPVVYDIKVSDPGTGDLIPIFGTASPSRVGQLMFVGSGWAWQYASGGAATVATTKYQWYRQNGPVGDPVAIPGATSSSYIPVVADYGKYVRVKLSVTGPGVVPYSVFSGSAGPVDLGVNTNDGAAGATMNPATDTLTAFAIAGSIQPAVPAPVLTYQWYRQTGSAAGVEIDGATKSTYKISIADYGKKVYVVITVHRDRFAAPDNAYGIESPHVNYTLTAQGTPAFATTPYFGETLTAPVPVFADENGDPPVTTPKYTYIWLRSTLSTGFGGHIIPGATGSTYKPTAADLYQYLQVSISVKYPGYIATGIASAESAQVHALSLGWSGGGPIASASTSSPPKLTATWSTDPFTVKPTSFTYQWYRQASPSLAREQIPGATASSYTLGQADVGYLMSVGVTAHKAGYGDVYQDTPGINYSLALNNVTVTVLDGGSPYLGSVLSSNYSGVTPSSVSSLDVTFQWYRQIGSNSPVAISGATHQNYTITAADLGATLFARLKAIKPGFVSSNTQFTPAIAPVLRSYAGSFTIDSITFPTGGVYRATVHNGLTTTGVKVTYQWYRDGVKVAGATSTAYKPPASKLPGTWKFEAKLTKVGYYVITYSSQYTYT